MGDARITVVGSANVDTTLRLDALPGPGETRLASSRRTSHGGKGANQAIAAAALGGHVAFVGALGDDAAGQAVLANLSSRGVDVSGTQVIAGEATGSAIILVADDGENVIVVDPAANGLLTADAVRAALLDQPGAVVLAQQEIPLAAVLAAAEAKNGAMFVLNPAPTPEPSPMYTTVLAQTDVLVPNRGELARLAGGGVPSSIDQLDACAAALAFDGALVVTLGADGAAVYARGGDRRLALIEPVRVDTVDTSGAGDVFCGILAHHLARGAEVVEAARLAGELAALSTTFPGAQVPPTFRDRALTGR